MRDNAATAAKKINCESLWQVALIINIQTFMRLRVNKTSLGELWGVFLNVSTKWIGFERMKISAYAGFVITYSKIVSEANH